MKSDTRALPRDDLRDLMVGRAAQHIAMPRSAPRSAVRPARVIISSANRARNTGHGVTRSVIAGWRRVWTLSARQLFQLRERRIGRTRAYFARRLSEAVEPASHKNGRRLLHAGIIGAALFGIEPRLSVEPQTDHVAFATSHGLQLRVGDAGVADPGWIVQVDMRGGDNIGLVVGRIGIDLLIVAA